MGFDDVVQIGPRGAGLSPFGPLGAHPVGLDPSHGARLTEMAIELGTSEVVPACTELPLVARPSDGVDLVDVTDLVANMLVSRVVGG